MFFKKKKKKEEKEVTPTKKEDLTYLYKISFSDSITLIKEEYLGLTRENKAKKETIEGPGVVMEMKDSKFMVIAKASGEIILIDKEELYSIILDADKEKEQKDV